MLAESNSQELASWIFGGTAFVFMLLVFLFGPIDLPRWKNRILAIISALLSGLFSYFLMGFIMLRANPNFTGLGRSAIQAGGGFALFVLVLFWWHSDFGPTSKRKWERTEKDFGQMGLRKRKWEQLLAGREKILETHPDTKTIVKLYDGLGNQSEGLKEIIDQMNNMDDHKLGQVIDNVGYYARNILQPRRDKNNYNLFRLLMEKLSRYDHSRHQVTWDYFLCILSDIFSMPPKGNFTRQIQKDMVVLLKNVILRVDKKHVPSIKSIIEKVMSDKKDEHDVARRVMEAILELDIKREREICQFVFEQAKKRAFDFSESFGFDFLSMLWQLEHRVFWLDLESLRNVLVESVRQGEGGMISLHLELYRELKVFVQPEKINSGIGNSGAVFRSLKGEAGRIGVKCVLSNGEDVCTCKGQDLNLRGFISERCERKAGEKCLIEILPRTSHPLKLKGSVTRLCADKDGNVPKGREILLEDEEGEGAAKELYRYIIKESRAFS